MRGILGVSTPLPLRDRATLRNVASGHGTGGGDLYNLIFNTESISMFNVLLGVLESKFY